MSDSYQAIYDAVRSRLHSGDIGAAVRDAIREQNWAHHIEQAAYEWKIAAGEQQRPCVVFKPELFKDWNMWCALLGRNIQDGVCAFGKTPQEAMHNFDVEWAKP